ncbi:Geranylgeranyl transferase type-1 subunit beta [Balamuthia mandrillaris]
MEAVPKAEEQQQASKAPEEAFDPTFSYKRHVQFLKANLNVLPTPYQGQDSNRLTVLYFVVSALDLIGRLDLVDKQQAIEWIYSLQIVPPSKPHPDDKPRWGFRGSPFLGLPWNPSCVTLSLLLFIFLLFSLLSFTLISLSSLLSLTHNSLVFFRLATDNNIYENQVAPETGLFLDQSHIAVTYTALCTLRILGDDYSRVDRKAIIAGLKGLQCKDGSFCPVIAGSESDVRFIYCAAAISHMLQDWSGVNVDAAVQYILSSQSYEGALAQGPGQEAHGGSTYCALAALTLMEALPKLPHRDTLLQWLIERQISGFQGRVNKDPDTCYSFWVGGSLSILGAIDLVNKELTQGFTFSCQTNYGGFSKCPGVHPDLLHTYFSLCGLSLTGSPGFAALEPSLGVTVRAATGLKPRSQL